MSHLDTMDQLYELLKTTRRKTMPASQFHGLLTSVICTPGVSKPVEWLPFLFPSTKNLKTIVELDWFPKCIELIVQAYEDMLFALRQGIFLPYFDGSDKKADNLKDAQNWCVGFMYGMSLKTDVWNVNENEMLAGMVAPILFLADPDQMQKDMPPEEFSSLTSDKDLLINALVHNLSQIYDHFNLGVKPELKKEWFNSLEAE